MNNKYNDFKTYTVRGNESVQEICMANNISESDLAQANPQIPLASYGGSMFSSTRYKLDVNQGDVLKIPFYNADKDKKGVKKISGKRMLKVGDWENYEIAEWFEGTPPEDRDISKVKWQLYHLQNGTKPVWLFDMDKGKIRFQEKAIGNKYKIVAYQHEPELNNESALLLNVEPSEKREILSIKVSDSNDKPINGPLSYGQTINVHVETTGMKGEYVYISLWEDDINGSGHSSNQNAKNKVIKDVKSLVGDKGVAHEILEIKADFEKIANAYLSKGDSNEGKQHEYYVTAYATGETKASPNFNVRNSEYQEQRRTETQDHLGGRTQPARTNVPPYRGNAGSNQPVAAKGVSKVVLTRKGPKQLLATIYSKGLKGKKIRFQVLEHDNSGNDKLVDQYYILNEDVYNINIFLNRIPQSKGGGFLVEGNEQELFVDVEVLEAHTHIKSKIVNVDINAFKVDVAESTTVAKVADTKLPEKGEKKKGCICKEQYADLIWGAKVSCDFRKKVVQIAKRLGKDPNLLMAAMALETGRTFSPTAGKGSSYVGLIQFGDDAASSVGTTKEALLKMTALQQLDYVEKYLEKKKDKLTTLTDFYMSILMPVDVGKGDKPNHVVFDNKYPLAYKKDGKTLTDLSKSRHYGYRQNPAFFYEEGEKEKVKKGGGKKYTGEGKTYIWEIEKFLSNIYNEGKNHKAKVFNCESNADSKPVVTESGTWNVVITEKYTGNKCEHEKPRKNCRRGKIDVYDHNKKIVFTISDCLLEGVAGEDRMKTNSDAPFGTYAISSTPFIMGTNSGQKRISYGPQPRLSFEPINGSGDEADKSNRSLIRIHGGRQEDKTTFKPLSNPVLKRTQGCIRVYDTDAKDFYDWWVKFHKTNPNVKPGKLKIVK
ncbi:L,D-transpeptidase [Flavobacterium sp. H122]|uniref:L,D-transpeptidase family protein n=1 Tax=Flavobacterium sp. H122 TaxID=2529860 RepID=UPI00145AD08F|nr:L,D-transpeptidase [Flavobacterium sp. H122]